MNYEYDLSRINNISKRIFERRKELGLSQNNLGSILADILELDHDKDRSTISDWENGVTTPSVKDLMALCSALKCDMDYLLGYSDYKTKEIEIASKTTGLSEKAISILTDSNYNNPDYNNGLSWLICNYSNYFQKLILNILELMKAKIKKERFNFVGAQSVSYAYENCTRYIHEIEDDSLNDNELVKKLLSDEPILANYFEDNKKAAKKKKH